MKKLNSFIKVFSLLSVFLLPALAFAADFTVTSESFTDGGVLPAECSADGGNKSPQLSWGPLPEGTDKVVIKMADLTAFDTCWVTEGKAVTSIAKGAQKLSDGASYSYHGPASGENHEYEFTVYAKKSDGSIIASGTLTGWYPKAESSAEPEKEISTADELIKLFSEGGNAKLVKAISVDKQLETDKKVRLSLNGKTLTSVLAASGDSQPEAVKVKKGGFLTIDDTAGGEIKGKNLFRVDSAALAIRAGNITTQDGRAVTVAGKNALLAVAGGSIASELKDSSSALISGLKGAENAGTAIKIIGGKLEAASYERTAVIYHPQNGTVTISGGELRGCSGIQLLSGNLVMTGGRIFATGRDIISSPDKDTEKPLRAASAVVLISDKDFEGSMSLDVSGSAELHSAENSAIYELKTDAETSKVTSVKMTGGVFEGYHYNEKSEKEPAVWSMQGLSSEEPEFEFVLTGGVFNGDVSVHIEDEKLTVNKRKDGWYVIAEATTVDSEIPAGVPEEICAEIQLSGYDSIDNKDCTDFTREADAEKVSDKTGGKISAAAMKEYEEKGLLTIAPETAKNIIRTKYGETAGAPTCLPVFTATRVDPAKTAMFSFIVKGSAFADNTPEKTKVLKVISDTDAEEFTYASEITKDMDGKYIVQTIEEESKITSGALKPDTDYVLSVFIKDGGKFDLNGKEKEITDPIVIAGKTSPAPVPETGGGSSGCDAGFAGLALLTLAPFVLRRKDK